MTVAERGKVEQAKVAENKFRELLEPHRVGECDCGPRRLWVPVAARSPQFVPTRRRPEGSADSEHTF